TRQRLAEQCGLSSASASNMVQDLLTAGLAREDGLESSSGGRPRSVIRAQSDAAYFVGADVGETEVALGLFDLTLNLRDTVRIGVESASATPQLLAHEVNVGLAELQERNPEEWGRLAGIGLA